MARRLVERGHRVRAMVRDRDSRTAKELGELGIDLVRGDITEGATLQGAAKGCDVVVHLVGIIKEKPPAATYERVHTRGTQNMLTVAREADVEKFVHMSALGARMEGTAYERTKYEAEEAVRRSDIPHVIFRPSVIVGPGGEFTGLLVRLVRLSPITPVIGDGRYRMQPVAVADVAQAFALAVERGDLASATLEVAGPHKLTYNRIIEIVAEELGYRRKRFHIPLGIVRPLVEFASNWRLPAPINAEQLEMLLEENVISGDKNALRDELGMEPRSLRSVIRELEG